MKIFVEEKDEKNLVMAGLEQIKAGKTKDFNAICDRLEKKYSNSMRLFNRSIKYSDSQKED